MMTAAKKIQEPTLEESAALIQFESLSPSEIFMPGGTEPLVKIVEDAVATFSADVTTDEGRKLIWHFSRKIASSKTGLEKMRKDYTEDARRKIERINEEGKKAVERIQELQDQVSAPLDAWKAREKERIDALNTALDHLKGWGNPPVGTKSVDIKDRLGQAEEFYSGYVWDSYQEAANDTIAELRIELENRYKEAVFQEERDAELEKLRIEKAARDRADEEERLRKEGEERARKAEEERRLQAEEQAAAAVKAEAERAARAEAAAEAAKVAQKEAEEKAERERVENAERLKREQEAAKLREEQAAEDAARKERERAEEVKRQEEQDRAKREQDRAHKARIHNEALAAIRTAGLTEDQGIAVLTAIAKGLVPHVRIQY